MSGQKDRLRRSASQHKSCSEKASLISTRAIPFGGKDGGKDAIATKDGIRFAIAVYFPRGQQTLNNIEVKFKGDLAGARKNAIGGIAFVTNQELTLGLRENIKTFATPTVVEIYHLERIAAILDGPGMAKIRQQFLDIEAESPPSIHLGGHGGVGPASGGGGGGAVGPDATGGSGGSGGPINIHGSPGEAPGAGGGGAGAIGDGAVGGDGGDGGEYTSRTLGPEDIGPGSGFHHVELRVGKGGVGGPGEDTIINFCDESGDVLRSVVSKGGNPGRPAQVSPPSRTPTVEDLQAGLRVTGILAAEFIRFRDGLWTVVEGGWDFWKADTNPFRVPLPLLVEIETGTIEPGTILDLKLVVRSPNGFQAHDKPQAVMTQESLVRRSRFAVSLELSGSQPGLWRVQVLAGTHLIGEFPIEVRAPGQE